MTKTELKPQPDKPSVRIFPDIKIDGSDFEMNTPDGFRMQDLMGMKTAEAATGVFVTALTALGKSAQRDARLVAAMFAELEPKDGVEAMLVSQITATHVAMTSLSDSCSYQSSYQVRESTERSMTRLSRTFLAQMDALKKYRAKAQQTVRVERVTVEDGGQAIVGDVNQGGHG